MAPTPARPATSMLQPKRAAPAVEGAGEVAPAAAELATVGTGVVARVELPPLEGIGLGVGGGTTGAEVGASGWPSDDSETTGTAVVAGAVGTGAADVTTGAEVGASGWPSEDSETTGATVVADTTMGVEVGASG